MMLKVDTNESHSSFIEGIVEASLLAASVVGLIDLSDDRLSDLGSGSRGRLGRSSSLSDFLNNLCDKDGSLTSFLIIALAAALEPAPDLGQDSDSDLKKTKGSTEGSELSDPDDESLSLTM